MTKKERLTQLRLNLEKIRTVASVLSAILQFGLLSITAAHFVFNIF